MRDIKIKLKNGYERIFLAHEYSKMIENNTEKYIAILDNNNEEVAKYKFCNIDNVTFRFR